MTTEKIEKLLAEQGESFDYAPKPAGTYVAVNVRNSIAYVAIQFPIRNDEFQYVGRIGRDLTTAEGYNAARLASVNILSQINRYVGFENIHGLNHLDIYYQAVEDWDEATIVANGASDLFIKILGPAGIHTRSLMGVHVLPKNLSVGVVASFTLKD